MIAGPVRSELDHPGERRHDPDFPRREVDDYRGIALDEDDPAEAVLLVGHHVVQFVLLRRRSLRRRLEGTGRQVAPTPGAGSGHHDQYVPFRDPMSAGAGVCWFCCGYPPMRTRPHTEPAVLLRADYHQPGVIRPGQVRKLLAS